MIAREYKALQTFTRNGRVFQAGKVLPVHAATWVDLREKQRAGLVSGGPAERKANAKATRDAATAKTERANATPVQAPLEPKAAPVPPTAVAANVTTPKGGRKVAA